MEAKGCAKSCVWKDARRHFYWSLRARLARSRILAQFAEAYPESTSEYRSQVLTQLAPLIGSDLRQDAAFKISGACSFISFICLTGIRVFRVYFKGRFCTATSSIYIKGCCVKYTEKHFKQSWSPMVDNE